MGVGVYLIVPLEPETAMYWNRWLAFSIGGLPTRLAFFFSQGVLCLFYQNGKPHKVLGHLAKKVPPSTFHFTHWSDTRLGDGFVVFEYSGRWFLYTYTRNN